jgi:hypothetical protein
VRRLAAGFFEDAGPDTLAIEHSGVKPLGLQKARVAKLTVRNIEDRELALRDGPRLREATLTLKDVEVTGPPFRYSGIGGGSFRIRMTESAVTEYLVRRGIKISVGNIAVPLKGLKVSFLDKGQARLSAGISVPIAGTVTAAATGRLVASTVTPGSIDFVVDPKDVKVVGNSQLGAMIAKPVSDGIQRLNPLVTTEDWPVTVDKVKVETRAGFVTISGDITGVR